MKNKENECYPMSVTGNSMVTLLPDEQLNIIFNRLDRIEPSRIHTITNPEDIPFIKQYHDTHHNITFNNSYTKIRKDESNTRW